MEVNYVTFHFVPVLSKLLRILRTSNSYNTYSGIRCFTHMMYEGRTESHEQHFLRANWEQQTKESAVVDGTSCCVILECLVT